jgi:hypothetical protein
MVKYKNFVFVKFFVYVWKSNGYAGGIYIMKINHFVSI